MPNASGGAGMQFLRSWPLADGLLSGRKQVLHPEIAPQQESHTACASPHRPPAFEVSSAHGHQALSMKKQLVFQVEICDIAA